ncbi:hypothetical protein [Abyssisolibacter fermentans]|uniref:hypothetical protein n=1 Tax=Abyssisolibacter fermentans TaxID=1766203 RepID=UPI00083387B1|nr:hypothetical protein [Abyssisolibacter fermentans]
MKKKYYYFIITVLILILIIYLNNSNKTKNYNVKEVMVENVEVKDYVETSINAKGTLKLKNNSIFSMSLDEALTVDKILIDDGIYVNVGTPFIRGHYIDEVAYKDKLSKVDMNLNYAEQEIKTLNSKILLKKDEIQNYGTLINEKNKLIEEQIVQEKNKYDVQLIPKAEYLRETASLNIKLKEQNIEFIKTLELLKIELDGLMFELKNQQADKLSLSEDKKRLIEQQDIEIKACSNGYIYLAQDIKINTICNKYETIANLYDVSKSENFYVEIKLTASEYKKLADNASGIIYLNDFEGTELNGTISEYTPIVYQNNGLNYYIIRMNVNRDNDTKRLLNNMPVSVKIDSKIKATAEEQNCSDDKGYLMLPATSVVNRDEKTVVFECKKSESGEEYFAKKHVVDIVFTVANNVFIKSDNLDKNALVITTGNYDLIGGERVIIDNGTEGGNFKIDIGD